MAFWFQPSDAVELVSQSVPELGGKYIAVSAGGGSPSFLQLNKDRRINEINVIFFIAGCSIGIRPGYMQKVKCYRLFFPK